MKRERAPLPDNLRKLINLIKQSRLFEVQELMRPGWPAEADGRPSGLPLTTAINTGFHSMVEVLLNARGGPNDPDGLLRTAVRLNRKDLVDLLCRFGANPQSVPFREACSGRDPSILNFLEAHGADLETDNALAAAMSQKNRAALGTYMRFRATKPSATIPRLAISCDKLQLYTGLSDKSVLTEFRRKSHRFAKVLPYDLPIEK